MVNATQIYFFRILKIPTFGRLQDHEDGRDRKAPKCQIELKRPVCVGEVLFRCACWFSLNFELVGESEKKKTCGVTCRLIFPGTNDSRQTTMHSELFISFCFALVAVVRLMTSHTCLSRCLAGVHSKNSSLRKARSAICFGARGEFTNKHQLGQK